MATLNVEKLQQTRLPSFDAISVTTLSEMEIGTGTTSTQQLAQPTSKYDSLVLENIVGLPAGTTFSVSNSGKLSVTTTITPLTSRVTVTFDLVAYWGLNSATKKYSVVIKAPTGQVAFTTPGTYQWIAPAGVNSVCVVAVGAGGRGGSSWSSGGNGGGGLGWKNNITVVPGQTYTVVVGDTGSSSGNSNDAATFGGNSYFIDLTTVAGYGGGNGGPNSQGTSNGYGGGYVGDGGGRGGKGGGPSWSEGGGGAGGYMGAGGNGGSNTNTSGGGGNGSYNAYSSTYGTGGGGGVGILGYTSNASGWYPAEVTGAGGNGGSGGSNASFGETSGYGNGNRTGGLYGGGGGGSGTSWGGGAGGSGAVRIIWGPGRAFPSTLTANQ